MEVRKKKMSMRTRAGKRTFKIITWASVVIAISVAIYVALFVFNYVASYFV